ncbi:helix-turn-helix transcriptional regulator [Paracoccus methylarcula]|uniref:helix-turn-helix transcriptional regulator n=1 Tax=Paracoccus methylarcula TaxID=72022 RepID=UPI0011CD4B74|nr:hypothetical protein [Paracoccus methylarcula]
MKAYVFDFSKFFGDDEMPTGGGRGFLKDSLYFVAFPGVRISESFAVILRYSNGRIEANHSNYIPLDILNRANAFIRGGRMRASPFECNSRFLWAILPGNKLDSGEIAVASFDFVAKFIEDEYPGARLTPFEVKLLCNLLSGRSLSEVAEKNERSIETLRTQARNIREKLSVTKTSSLDFKVGFNIVNRLMSKSERIVLLANGNPA